MLLHLSKIAAGVALAALAITPLGATVQPAQSEPPPSARPGALDAPKGPPPSRPAPSLTGRSQEARENVSAFLQWASASTGEQVAELRQALAAARDNGAIAGAFCQEAEAAQKGDHSQALMSLSLLGEMRSPHALGCLKSFIALPLPTSGTEVEGEILERKALEILQAKAIQGLAYLQAADADAVVLQAVREHPSRLVRSEAAIAYLWNHRFTPQAREALKPFVRPGEEVFLDRPIRSAEQSAEEYNRQLAAYLEAHPELQPPPPESRAPEKVEESAPPPVWP
jgi:hypothetical protein